MGNVVSSLFSNKYVLYPLQIILSQASLDDTLKISSHILTHDDWWVYDTDSWLSKRPGWLYFWEQLGTKNVCYQNCVVTYRRLMKAIRCLRPIAAQSGMSGLTCHPFGSLKISSLNTRKHVTKFGDEIRWNSVKMLSRVAQFCYCFCAQKVAKLATSLSFSKGTLRVEKRKGE